MCLVNSLYVSALEGVHCEVVKRFSERNESLDLLLANSILNL